jgi:hypothetical protein
VRRIRSASLVVRLAGAGLIALVVSACPNDARDSHCEPEGGDDRCISEPEGSGPLVKEAACATPSASDAPPATDECPDFEQVMEFMRDPERGNCTASGCHGLQGTAAIGIWFPADDSCATWKALTTTSGSVGRPYLAVDDPESEENESLKSWMYCNVLGLEGGGFPMPKPGGVHDPEDAELIRRYILCRITDPCDDGGGT